MTPGKYSTGAAPSWRRWRELPPTRSDGLRPPSRGRPPLLAGHMPDNDNDNDKHIIGRPNRPKWTTPPPARSGQTEKILLSFVYGDVDGYGYGHGYGQKAMAPSTTTT